MEVWMARVRKEPRRALFALMTVFAVGVAACSNGTATPAPATNGPTATATAANQSAAASRSASNGGSSLSGAAANLANLASYKFTMTLAGDPATAVLTMLDAASATDNTPVTYHGTVIVKPAPAADISLVGLHVIEIGGSDYMDVGGNGGFIKTDVQSPSILDSLSPAQMFSSMVDGSTVSGYNEVGSDTKDGVIANHYQASPAALAQYASVQGLASATWTADIWLATDGGYPVSMAIVATAKDNTIPYETNFDITNVNDPANNVAAPTDVVGA
jgi:hypothetical protein